MIAKALHLCGIVFSIATTCSAADIGVGTEIFRKSLDKATSIVVIRRTIPVVAAKQLFDRQLEPADHIYQISVELQGDAITPIVLATVLHGERDNDPAGKGFNILEMYREDGFIFFTVVTGPELALWKVDPFGKTTWVELVGWQVWANRRKVEPTELGIEVAHLDHQRLRITIQIKNSREKIPPSIFEQIGKLWEFKATQTAFDLMFMPATRENKKGE